MTGYDDTDPGKTSAELDEIDSSKFDYFQAPEIDGVNLQCINSTDFVVGKQTTFNGPVTIINCAEGATKNAEDLYKPDKEEIVLREKIITPAAVSEMKAFAEKKTTGGVCGNGSPVESGLVGKVDSKDGSSGKRNFLARKALKVPIAVWIVLALVTVVGIAAYFFGFGDGEEVVPAAGKTIAYNGRRYNYITREEWNARPPLSTIEMKLPVRYVIISHTAGGFCYERRTCMEVVRNIQAYHFTKPNPYSDIAYSFLVGGDGNIYEGRGWRVRDAVEGFANGRNINVNFIGSFHLFDGPTYPQTEAAKALIEYGVNNSYIDPNYSLISQNATMATLSPGIQLYKEIMNWPHFDPDPRQSIDEESNSE